MIIIILNLTNQIVFQTIQRAMNVKMGNFLHGSNLTYTEAHRLVVGWIGLFVCLIEVQSRWSGHIIKYRVHNFWVHHFCTMCVCVRGAMIYGDTHTHTSRVEYAREHRWISSKFILFYFIFSSYFHCVYVSLIGISMMIFNPSSISSLHCEGKILSFGNMGNIDAHSFIAM